MSAELILTLYLALFFIEVAFDLALNVKNIQFVKQNANKIPDVFAATIDAETYSKSVSYTLSKGYFGIFSSLCSSCFVLLVVLSGSLGFLDSYLSQFALHRYVHGLVYFYIVSLAFYLFGAPFSLYCTFVIEEKFGFNSSTLKLWFVDQLKSLLVSCLILAPLLIGLFWFMDSTGQYWWIWAFGFIAGFQLILMYLYPSFIAPLFNKFKPLEEGSAKEKINALAKNANFKTSGIFVMDGSKRSQHANAYFTGFGRNKRIVLFDTLLNSLSEPQMLAVLAHEIGHEKLNHIKKSLALSLIVLFLGFWCLSLLCDYMPLFQAFGLYSISYHGALVIFSFASSPITFWLSPFMSMLSRRHEYEADQFSVKLIGNSNDLGDALLALSKKSLSNLTPHPLYSFFHYSHPTLHERLIKLNSKV